MKLSKKVVTRESLPKLELGKGKVCILSVSEPELITSVYSYPPMMLWNFNICGSHGPNANLKH